MFGFTHVHTQFDTENIPDAWNLSPTCFERPRGRKIRLRDPGPEDRVKVLLNSVCHHFLCSSEEFGRCGGKEMCQLSLRCVASGHHSSWPGLQTEVQWNNWMHEYRRSGYTLQATPKPILRPRVPNVYFPAPGPFKTGRGCVQMHLGCFLHRVCMRKLLKPLYNR